MDWNFRVSSCRDITKEGMGWKEQEITRKDLALWYMCQDSSK